MLCRHLLNEKYSSFHLRTLANLVMVGKLLFYQSDKFKASTSHQKDLTAYVLVVKPFSKVEDYLKDFKIRSYFTAYTFQEPSEV